MGERKGTNKYYPPDFDPVKHGSLNGYHKTHPLRERARKLSQGILIIRFEMPYNIWCDGCKNHIGMGVRYNAEKKKVGNYYTTPIYRFRMKCHLCVNYIEMQTDPATCDYLIVCGANRKEERWDMADNEQILTTERADKQKLETDAMFKLDHSGKDQEKLKRALPSLSELQDYQSSKKDDFQLNSALRRRFRTEKKVQAEQEEQDDSVRTRTNLSIPLLPERDEDRRLAALLTYQAADSYEDRKHSKRKEISSRSWFTSSSSSSSPGGAAGSLLLKLSMQGKEAAVAKALASSPGPLICRRCPGGRTQPCGENWKAEPQREEAARKAEPQREEAARKAEPQREEAARKAEPQREEAARTDGSGSSETLVNAVEEADEGLTKAKHAGKERGDGLGALSSIMAEYSDSDSDPGL
ncbi:probable splicing factor YJU2B isoform X2 [Pseudoliparis swirei]|uniref:probable splicing factor YJU2B isoform X2 n=1 Tax=Pseudoliparis swirei TaxID=2059687 RepID=UPI0024BEBCFB|nr:probable splicing factor YJU2B isoform X2 [Pseudoliparis swirei]